MRFIPDNTDLEKDYKDRLKQEREEKRLKRLRNQRKWNPSLKPKKKRKRKSF